MNSVLSDSMAALNQLITGAIENFIAFLSEWLPLLVHGLLGFIP